MLGLAQLGARLGVQLEAQLGIGWEIGIRSSAGLTYRVFTIKWNKVAMSRAD